MFLGAPFLGYFKQVRLFVVLVKYGEHSLLVKGSHLLQPVHFPYSVSRLKSICMVGKAQAALPRGVNYVNNFSHSAVT